MSVCKRISISAVVGLAMGCEAGNMNGLDTADMLPSPAPLTELSDGECPDMTASGISSFSSGGKTRRVGVIFPNQMTEDMPVIFTFHGLTAPEYMPMESMISGFDLQRLSNQKKIVFVVPEAEATTLPGIGSMSLWGILGDEADDLVFYDDLRTCVAESLPVDLHRVSAWGHSGGALWTSVLSMARSDTLSTFLEFSGGTGIEIPLLGGPYISYEPLTHVMPAVLGHGGDTDLWPDASFTMIDFQATTLTYAESLAADGHLVVSCDHGMGHNTIPPDGWDFAVEWLKTHVYGMASPYESLSVEDIPSWCAYL